MSAPAALQSSDRITGKAAPATRLAPVPMARAPGVNDLLERLGLGVLADEDLEAHVGRNDNWAGVTERGHGVFVKRLHGADAGLRMARAVEFARTHRGSGNDALGRPALLGHDVEASVLVYELLPGSVSGAELQSENGFDEARCVEAAELLAELHAEPPPRVHEGRRDLPPLVLAEAVPLEIWRTSSAAQLECWRLIQKDAPLLAALRRIRAEEARARPVGVHADLRLDQLLLHGGRLHLIDWEEFCAGDAARDVGGFVGEWLHRAVHGIPGALTGTGGYDLDREPTHEEIVACGTAELARLRPRMRAFWQAYCTVRPGLDPDFELRAVAYSGWHLIDRLIASAFESTRLRALDRAAAGIGRTALLRPDRFTAALGIDQRLREYR